MEYSADDVLMMQYSTAIARTPAAQHQQPTPRASFNNRNVLSGPSPASSTAFI
jgi:hypothetical protein